VLLYRECKWRLETYYNNTNNRFHSLRLSNITNPKQTAKPSQLQGRMLTLSIGVFLVGVTWCVDKLLHSCGGPAQLFIACVTSNLLLMSQQETICHLYLRIQYTFILTTLLVRRLYVLTAVVMKCSCSACYLLHVGFLLGWLFDPEDGGDMFLRNVSWLSTDYTALYLSRQNSL
jgi:hypothetical protein